ncbi:hypothetical protein RB195_011612 [Necator americanus]|uniref:Uncharacterized protein n=1 Tax=Necator americanus TaxID=51031 RepID=A0ABR1D379_NECAM
MGSYEHTSIILTVVMLSNQRIKTNCEQIRSVEMIVIFSYLLSSTHAADSPSLPLIFELVERAPVILPFVPVACQSSPVVPPFAWDTKSIILFFEGHREETI